MADRREPDGDVVEDLGEDPAGADEHGRPEHRVALEPDDQLRRPAAAIGSTRTPRTSSARCATRGEQLRDRPADARAHRRDRVSPRRCRSCGPSWRRRASARPDIRARPRRPRPPPRPRPAMAASDGDPGRPRAAPGTPARAGTGAPERLASSSRCRHSWPYFVRSVASAGQPATPRTVGQPLGASSLPPGDPGDRAERLHRTAQERDPAGRVERRLDLRASRRPR